MLDANTEVMQQINFAGNLDQLGNAAIHFILEEVKETVLDFSRWMGRELWKISRICFGMI